MTMRMCADVGVSTCNGHPLHAPQNRFTSYSRIYGHMKGFVFNNRDLQKHTSIVNENF